MRLHEQFGYAYDSAGNLNYRTNNALVQTFTPNNLNELSTVGRSGTLTVAGATSVAATNVTVNGSAATRYADNAFAAAGFTITNGSNAYTAIAQDSYGRKDTNSAIFNLPSSVSFVYDLNGNLTSDGTRVFDYDDENQLIRVTVTNSWKSEFTYDGKSRRRIRKEFTWSGSWVQASEVHYIYDGNVVIQERDANNLPTLTLTRRGNRLLARSDMTTATPTHAYFHTDGNANVTAMINGQQFIVARYVYDPFGNTLSLRGALATVNLYRFASQELHSNSGVIYFGRRFYDPNLQRFVNRDPISESGGVNLFAFVGNNPINKLDAFGLCWYKPWTWLDAWLEPDMEGNQELPNGDLYGPSLTPNLQPPEEEGPTSDENLAKMNNGAMQLGEAAHAAAQDAERLRNALITSLATLPLLGMVGAEAEAFEEAAAAKTTASNVSRAANSVEEWLGQGYTKVESETSDLVLRSADGTKQIRFDLSNPHGLDPHINVETWQPRNLYPGDGRFVPVDNIHVFPKP